MNQEPAPRASEHTKRAGQNPAREDTQVKLVGAAEWRKLRALRLTTLRDAPYAFGATAEEEERLPETQWREWARGTTFVAVQGERWMGMVGAYPDEDPEGLVVFGMWVDPARRRSGIGHRLLQALIEWARQRGARRLRLGVTESNEAAVRFYETHGFVPTGRREPLRSDPSLSEIEMERDLAPP